MVYFWIEILVYFLININRYKFAILHLFNAGSMQVLRTLRAKNLHRTCVAPVEICERVPYKVRSKCIQNAKTVHTKCIGFAKTVRRIANKVRRKAPKKCKNGQNRNPKQSFLPKSGIQNHHFWLKMEFWSFMGGKSNYKFKH